MFDLHAKTKMNTTVVFKGVVTMSEVALMGQHIMMFHIKSQ